MFENSSEQRWCGDKGRCLREPRLISCCTSHNALHFCHQLIRFSFQFHKVGQAKQWVQMMKSKSQYETVIERAFQLIGNKRAWKRASRIVLESVRKVAMQIPQKYQSFAKYTQSATLRTEKCARQSVRPSSEAQLNQIFPYGSLTARTLSSTIQRQVASRIVADKQKNTFNGKEIGLSSYAEFFMSEGCSF